MTDERVRERNREIRKKVAALSDEQVVKVMFGLMGRLEGMEDSTSIPTQEIADTVFEKIDKIIETL